MKKSILRTELEKMEAGCCGPGPCSTMEPVRKLVDNAEKEERLFRDRVAALLKRIEHCVPRPEEFQIACPACGEFSDGHHLDDCALAALLRECGA